MLWAIDVGNTQTVVGIHNGSQWIGDWRIQTDRARTEDEWRSLLWTLCQKQQIPWHADGFMISSVVPPVDEVISRWAKQDFGLTAHFLRNGQQVQMNVDYDPPHAVGADRIANALGALEIVKPPFIVVDFGTATTLDVVDKTGTYVGGVILPGVMVSLEGLVGRTAKLPAIRLEGTKRALGKNTVESLQSGVVRGYSGAIDTLVRQVSDELDGEVSVLSTGGLGKLFVNHCETIQEHKGMLTLDGLRVAYSRITG